MNIRHILLTIMLIVYPISSYSEMVKVHALFTNKVVLLINGNLQTLKVGETSPEGIKVIKANSRMVTLELNGKQRDLSLSSSTALSYTKPKVISEQIFANERGMFMAVGSINGQSVRFLLDTGATTVAMNTNQAKDLGVRYRIIGTPTRVNTASGVANAYHVKLKSVKIGKIEKRNVDAVVIEATNQGPILLGMSFLDTLSVEKNGKKITLTKKK